MSKSDYYDIFKPKRRYGLRFYDEGDFNLDHLANLLNMDTLDVKRMFPSYYGLDIFWPFDTNFKFCNKCLAIGYHSPIHQARELKYCPIHRSTKLRYVDFYHMHVNGFRYDITFLDCNHITEPDFTSIEFYPNQLQVLLSALPAVATRRLKSFVDLSLNVAGQLKLKTWLFAEDTFDSISSGVYRLLVNELNLPTSYTRLFKPINSKNLSQYRYAATQVKTKTRAKSKPICSGYITFNRKWKGGAQSELLIMLHQHFLTYKRKLSMMLDKSQHSACIDRIRNMLISQNLKNTYDICPLALAFVRWSVHWGSSSFVHPTIACTIADDHTLSGSIGTETAIWYHNAMEWLAADDRFDIEAPSSRWIVRTMYTLTLSKSYDNAVWRGVDEGENERDPRNHWPGIYESDYPKFYVISSEDTKQDTYLFCGSERIGLQENKRLISYLQWHSVPGIT